MMKSMVIHTMEVSAQIACFHIVHLAELPTASKLFRVDLMTISQAAWWRYSVCADA